MEMIEIRIGRKCGSAASGAERLRLSGTSSNNLSRGSASETTKRVSDGKAEPFRTGCGKAAGALVHRVPD